MNKIGELLRKITEFFRNKGNRLKKMRRRSKIKLAAVCLALVLVFVVVGRLFFGRKGPGSAIAEVSVQSATAETGTISTTVEGTGTLQQGTAENVTVPVGVKMEEILVEAGDTVTEGQQLATVNAASVASQLLEVEEQLEDVNDEIDDLSDDAEEEGTTEYLEALVLKGERKDLRQARKALNALLDSGAVVADRDGVIGSVYVSENTQVTSSSDSTGSSSSSTVSSASVSGMSASYSTATASLLTMRSNTAATAGNDSGLTTVSLSSYSGNTAKTAGAQGSWIRTAAVTSDDTGETDSREITSCDISVTAPETGGTPQSAITATDAYTGNISWNCTASTFQAGTSYTAKITLTAKEGYAFSSNTAATVSGASSVSTKVGNEGSTLTVQAVFAATAAESTEGTTSTEASGTTGSTSGTTGTTQSGTTAESSTGSGSSSTSATENGTNSAGQSTQSGNSATIGSGGTNGQNGNGLTGSGTGGSASGYSTASVSSGSTGSSASSTSSEEDYSLYEAAAFSIVSEDEAVVSIQVDELDILSVQEGQTAVITMDAVEDQEFEGTITDVSTTSTGDSSSAKYPVEITLDKTDDMLYGMSASATIEVDTAENVVVIPVSALQESGNSTFVYTESDEEGNLSGEVEVTTGLSDGSQVEITSGLAEGDTVYYTRTGTSSDEISFPSMGDMSEMPSGGRGGSGGEMPSGGFPGGGGGNAGGFGQ